MIDLGERHVDFVAPDLVSGVYSAFALPEHQRLEQCKSPASH
jgi:hypothetical protein